MSFRLQGTVNSVSFSHDGRFLVSAGADGSALTEGTAKIWELDPLTRRWSSGPKLMGKHRAALRSAVFHPTRSDVILTASEDGSAEIWRKAENGWGVVLGFAEAGAKSPAPLNGAIFSPDGSRVLTMPANQPAQVWEWNLTGATKLLTTLDDPQAAPAGVQCADFSDDGNWIVTARGMQAWLWRADWGKGSIQRVNQQGIAGHAQEITSVAFSHDAGAPRRLLTGSRDFTARLWDTSALEGFLQGKAPDQDSFRELLTLEEHTGEVTSVEFSKHNQGRYVLTAAKDGQAIIWPSEPIE